MAYTLEVSFPTQKTTWYWAFSHYHARTFTRNHFVQKIDHFVQDRGWPRVSLTTIKNDVACFIRTYTAQQTSGKKIMTVHWNPHLQNWEL